MFLVLLSSLLLSFSVYALEATKPADQVVDGIEKHDCEKAHQDQNDTIFDATHSLLSRGILNLTDSVDGLIGDDKYVTDGKNSRGIVSLTNRVTDGEGYTTVASFSLQVRLPRTENKLKLVVDNLSDQTRNNEVEPTELDRLEDEAEETDIAAAFKFLFDFGPEWESSSNFGVKIGFPMDPFTNINVRRNFKLADWELKFSQSLFWFNTTGFGEVTRGDIDFELPDDFLLRFANSASYQFDEEFFRINNSLTLVHPLDKDRSLSYAVGASADTQTAWEVKSYSTALAYRQKILRKWIFLDIIPGFSWSRGNDFKRVASIAIRFESVFGALDY